MFRAATIAALVASVNAALPLTVHTDAGDVSGHISANAANVREYIGLRYAEPPVGELRFADPAPFKAYDASPYAASGPIAGCPQACNLPPGNCPATTSEDCLFLNVWAPTEASDKYPDGYPVFVFLHGGAYQQGYAGALYVGDSLVQDDVIVVTPNYRLGALGFMKSESMGGNYGMKDQLMALQWVQRNIASFGGNPEQVTIGGQSAGAMSVGTIMSSPEGKGLFARAIMESNPLALPFHNNQTASVNANDLSTYVGCPVDDVACLRTVSADAIVEASKAAVKLNLRDLFLNFLPWNPVVGTSVLPMQPFDALSKGEVESSVPLLIGSVRNDGLLFVYELFTSALGKREYERMIEATFGRKHKDDILALYPSNMLNDETDTRPVLDVLATDLLFYCPGRNISRGLEAKTGMPAFRYRFDHVFSFYMWGEGYEFCGGDIVCHGSELVSVFNVYTDGETVTYDPTAAELDLAQSTMGYWTNFMHSSNPNDGGAYVPVAFPRYVEGEEEILVIDQAPAAPYVAAHQRDSFCDFWDNTGSYIGW